MEDLQKLINEWKQEAAALMSKIQNNPVLDNYQFINGSAQRLRLCIAEVELLLQQQPNSESQPQLQQANVSSSVCDVVKWISQCPYNIDEATVPKAGIDAAPGQVVLNLSLSYKVWLDLKEAAKHCSNIIIAQTI